MMFAHYVKHCAHFATLEQIILIDACTNCDVWPFQNRHVALIPWLSWSIKWFLAAKVAWHWCHQDPRWIVQRGFSLEENKHYLLKETPTHTNRPTNPISKLTSETSKYNMPGVLNQYRLHLKLPRTTNIVPVDLASSNLTKISNQAPSIPQPTLADCATPDKTETNMFQCVSEQSASS